MGTPTGPSLWSLLSDACLCQIRDALHEQLKGVSSAQAQFAEMWSVTPYIVAQTILASKSGGSMRNSRGMFFNWGAQSLSAPE